MSVRRLPLLLILAAGLVPAAAARADKLDNEDKKWLDDVTPLMLPQEEKTFRGLKDKAERAEFKKIFWARRAPNPEVPRSEDQDEYLKVKAEADRMFRFVGRPGSLTDCGRVFIMLGKPDNVKKEMGESVAGPRTPETWTYRDRPGVTFKDGQIEVDLDSECRLPPGSRMVDSLNRMAETRILHPNIDYRRGKDGRLTKLVDLLPKPTPARALLKEPRQDFNVAAQANFLKTEDGGTALLGLVKGDAAGLTVEEAGTRKTARVTLCAAAVDADGNEAATVEQETLADVQSDGSFRGSFRMGLKPGKYTLRAAALQEKSKKGAVATLPVEVPNLNQEELTMATLTILQDVEDVSDPNPNPQHAYAAYLLGKARLIPHFGNVFSKADAISIFYQYYDARVDEATGKASALVSVTLLKGGKPVAKAGDAPGDTTMGGNVVGPVPLEKYEPGSYVAQLKIKDNVAKKEYVQEVPFEIKP